MLTPALRTLEGVDSNITCPLCDDHCSMVLVRASITGVSGLVRVGRLATECPYIEAASVLSQWCVCCCHRFVQPLMSSKSYSSRQQDPIATTFNINHSDRLLT